MSLLVYVDGGSRGNPGPAAAGVVILRHDGVPLHEAGYFLGRQTNNVAEYMGLIRALELLADQPALPLAIHSDSELLVRQITGEYRVKNEHLAALYERVQILLLKRSGWKIQHVPRERNRRADELANMCLDRGADVIVCDLRAAAAETGVASAESAPRSPAVARQAPTDPTAPAAQAAPGDRTNEGETAAGLPRRVLVARRDGAEDDSCPAGGCGIQRLELGTTLPGGICIFAAHAILPTLLAMQSTSPADFHKIPTMTVRCARSGCKASFQLSPARPENGRAGRQG